MISTGRRQVNQRKKMAERIKLNKISLREQKQKLAMYSRFLPALEARKQQFLMQLALTRKEIQQKEARLQEIIQEISVWSGLLEDMGSMVKSYLEIKEVKSSVRNVADLKVPYFQGVTFNNPPYGFFSTPYSFEAVVTALREAVEINEEIRMLRIGEEMLFNGFRKTSQRINLYEQRLIPGCREAMRKIAVYLQDQQSAAVGVAKVAKRMLEDVMHSSGA